MPKRPLTDALEAFADALEAAGINPRLVEVSMPLSDWQHLARTLDEERGSPVPGDIGRVELAGVRYLIRYAAR
jgi:hypothetical protein